MTFLLTPFWRNWKIFHLRQERVCGSYTILYHLFFQYDCWNIFQLQLSGRLKRPDETKSYPSITRNVHGLNVYLRNRIRAVDAFVLNGTAKRQLRTEDGCELICNMPGISEHGQQFCNEARRALCVNKGTIFYLFNSFLSQH
jgi:hypothetical protein